MTIITTHIQPATSFLDNGDLIAIPTETVYGLAANAFDPIAVQKIFELKKRPSYNPLIVHIKDLDSADEVAQNIPQTAKLLAKTFWPGPLTLVLEKKSIIPDIITAGKNTVAVRVPNHPLVLQLLANLKYPLAAPSANPFGSISPTEPNHVFNYFNGKLPLILDGGKCAKGIESTIIGFNNETPILYRHGSISVEQIEDVTGKIEIAVKDNSSPIAPGMLSKHYAPKTTTYLSSDIKKDLAHFSNKKIGVLLFKEALPEMPNTVQLVLSTTGSFDEAARNLYAAMHQLDALQLDAIIVERVPHIDLGRSINDRLERAISKE
jgi:L-threonylcarbamoyladenylate synthase